MLKSKVAVIGKDVTADSYKKIGIEDFGKSILKKFGWKEPEKPDERFSKPMLPRHQRLGLGATPARLKDNDKVDRIQAGSRVTVISGSHAD